MGWTVVGQEGVLSALQGAIARERVAHAYLFAGPAHTGKTLTALQFAQALNCTAPEDCPCGRCRQCERIAAGAHADVEIIGLGGACDESEHRHTADEARQIRICQIRRLERIVSRAPYEGRYRVLIIEPADALGREASGALLKTLEEPPPNVVMVLVTDHEDALEPTVRSRARRVAFRGLARAAIERALRTRWDVEPERAAELARLAAGRLGWAVIALHDETMMAQRREALERAEALATAPVSERFVYAGELGGAFSRDRAAVQGTLELWEEWWRDLLLAVAGRPEQARHRDWLDRLRPFAAQCDVRAAARALRAIREARQQLDENASPVLALEAMMLALPELRPNAVGQRLAAGGDGGTER